jgi:hypothetical protein
MSVETTLLAIWAGAMVIAAVAVIVALIAEHRRKGRPVIPDDIQPPEPTTEPVRVGLLTPPPMIDRVTLRNFLIHHAGRDGVWSEVVAELYTTAASDPQIADYFRDTDLDVLARHFTRALTMVAHTGVTSGMLERLQSKHAWVRASDGTPITGEVYDRVIGVLVSILARHGVPNRGLEALALTIAPFRDAVVGQR